MDGPYPVQIEVMLELLRDVASDPLATGVSQRATALLETIEHHTGQHCHYTCTGKGGRYVPLGLAKGAGTSRGQVRTIYRNAFTGELFFREPGDFASRMAPIEDDASVCVEVAEPLPVLARGFYLPPQGSSGYNFLDDTDDPGECDGSVPAVIVPKAEFERVRHATGNSRGALEVKTGRGTRSGRQPLSSQ